MTSKELIKTLTCLTLALILHLLILGGFRYSFSPDIKFKRIKTEMTIRPFRPRIPRFNEIGKAVKKGDITPGKAVRVEEEQGKKIEMDLIGETKVVDDTRSDEFVQQELIGEEVDKSVLSDFLAKIRSNKIQDKLRDIENRKKHMWKGGGVSLKDLEGKKGDGGIQGKFEEGYLDPRVKLVVASYPVTAIERNHPLIAYPDMQVKKHELQSGWCNVVIRIYTDEMGKIAKQRVLRPTGDEMRERLFLEHTLQEIKSWEFESARAEIIIDVRYFVE